MKNYISSLFFLTSIFIYSQADTSANFLYLNNKTFVYNNNVSFVFKQLGGHYYTDGVKEYKYKEVKFHKNDLGFFANIYGLGVSSGSPFAELKRTGKINLFETGTKNTTFSSSNYGSSMMMPALAKGAKLFFYNKTLLGDIQAANYDNLKVDLADNEVSVKELDLFKKNQNKQYISYGIGSVLILTGGILTIINHNKNPQESALKPLPIVLSLSGAGAYVFGSVVYANRKHKNLTKAIDIYNGW